MNKYSRLSINAIFFVNGFLFANWAARIPDIQSYFSLSYQEIGQILFAAALGSLIGMPAAGIIIPAYGSRLITLVAAIAYAISIPLYLSSFHFLILIGAFVFMGMCVGILDVAMNDQAVEIEKRYQQPIMSFFHAMFSAGMITGAGTGMICKYFEVSLVTDFALMSSICLPIILWSSKHFIPADRRTKNARSSVFRLPDRSLWVIGIIAFCCMLGEGAMSDWTGLYMENVAISSKNLAPMALLVFSCCMMVGRLFGDRCRTIFGDKRLLLGGSTIALLGALIAITFPCPIPVILSSGLIGIGLSTIVPIAYSIAGKAPNLDPGVGISMVTTIGYSGFLLGPPIIGYIADVAGLRIGFTFLIASFFLMLILSICYKQYTSESNTSL